MTPEQEALKKNMLEAQAKRDAAQFRWAHRGWVEDEVAVERATDDLDAARAAYVAAGGCGVMADESIPMLLWCPSCGERHIDVGEFETKVHHTHACQHCGMVWRPAVVPTRGVQFLPGFKNAGGVV